MAIIQYHFSSTHSLAKTIGYFLALFPCAIPPAYVAYGKFFVPKVSPAYGKFLVPPISPQPVTSTHHLNPSPQPFTSTLHLNLAIFLAPSSGQYNE
ncbi:hypothetical protein OUZ56_000894 [Daphnia magna]|uniref:Uncharacterized protein n=1 Tax=Daphnia magna TaxID=35525 RepID=A0ABR0A1M4_9CRUS|nr:hypothetical protein OUZ56_000894 [Daphnia magna]